MTGECCTGECLTASTPQTGLFPCRVPAREDEDPPAAADLFREAGLAIAIPLVIALLITLGTGITMAAGP